MSSLFSSNNMLRTILLTLPTVACHLDPVTTQLHTKLSYILFTSLCLDSSQSNSALLFFTRLCVCSVFPHWVSLFLRKLNSYHVLMVSFWNYIILIDLYFLNFFLMIWIWHYCEISARWTKLFILIFFLFSMNYADTRIFLLGILIWIF